MGHHRHWVDALTHEVTNREAEQTANLALGHGVEDEQGQGRHHAGALFLLVCEVANLGAVAVDDHHPPPIAEEVLDRARHA